MDTALAIAAAARWLRALYTVRKNDARKVGRAIADEAGCLVSLLAPAAPPRGSIVAAIAAVDDAMAAEGRL